MVVASIGVVAEWAQESAKEWGRMPESSRSGNLMSKRDRLARSLGSVGLLRLLWLWRRLVPDRLMVVNYHRILDPKEDYHEDRVLNDPTMPNYRWRFRMLTEEAE